MTTERATGTFEVKLVPLDTLAHDAPLGRLSIDKQIHGDLEATAGIEGGKHFYDLDYAFQAAT